MQQYRDTEQAYGGREAFYRAKGAGKTLLNYEQWVQVRTPNFKRWFGDWEIASLGKAMRRVRGSGQAKAVKDQIVGKELKNQETGFVATVSGESFGKMLNSSSLSVSTQAHMQALGNLDKLFPLATRTDQRPGKKPNDAGRIEAIHHFAVPMPFDDEVLMVKILAKQFVDPLQGNRLYLVEAVEIETPASFKGESVTSEDGRSPHLPAGVDTRLAQMVAAVKGEGVSKVVGADGDPLVVYHGTRADFSEFRPSKLDGGIYFSSSPSEAGEFARMARNDGTGDRMKTVPVYLSMRNPSVLDVEGQLFDEYMGNLFRDAIAKAKADGRDGLIVRNVDNLGGEVSDTYIAFSPHSDQIRHRQRWRLRPCKSRHPFQSRR